MSGINAPDDEWTERQFCTLFFLCHWLLISAMNKHSYLPNTAVWFVLGYVRNTWQILVSHCIRTISCLRVSAIRKLNAVCLQSGSSDWFDDLVQSRPKVHGPYICCEIILNSGFNSLAGGFDPIWENIPIDH